MTAIDDFFDDLHYPGSKRERRPAPPPKPEEERWDARPIRKKHRGEVVEFFDSGALARALGKSTVTIRTWERKGYIPRAPFRLPGYVDAEGVEQPGRRVYTRELIDIAVEEFSNRNLLGAARVEWNRYTDLTIALVERWKN